MARLTAKARRALPAKTFAGPGRSFPIPDAGHAKAALALIGHAPASARPHIRAVAEAKLHAHGAEKPQRVRMGGFKSHGLPYTDHTDHDE